MTSKQVIDRERSSRTVVATLEEFRGRAGTGVEAALAALAEPGERISDVALLIHLVARLLDRRTGTLVGADREHEIELGGDAQAREDRDRAHREVVDQTVALRGVVQASFGDVGLKSLGIWDTCPSDAQGALSYARNFAQALHDEAIVLPRSRLEHVRFERAGVATSLAEKVAQLESALLAVAREESAAKGTQARKDEAMAAHDRAFRIATSLGTALFQLGGLDDLADRIRPSTRRPGTLDRPPVADEPSPSAE